MLKSLAKSLQPHLLNSTFLCQEQLSKMAEIKWLNQNKDKQYSNFLFQVPLTQKKQIPP